MREIPSRSGANPPTYPRAAHGFCAYFPLMPLDIDSWLGDPEYRAALTLTGRSAFIFKKLAQADGSKLRAIIVALWRDKTKDLMEMTAFEWETILRFVGASQREIEDVRKQIGTAWGAYSHAEVVARTLALLDSRDWGPIDHRHLMNALSGYFVMNMTKPLPDTFGVWQRAFRRLETDRTFLEWIEGQEYADGTLGAWTQQALQGERTRSGRRPSDGA